MAYDPIDLIRILDDGDLLQRVEKNFQTIRDLLLAMQTYENKTGLSVNTTVAANQTDWTAAYSGTVNYRTAGAPTNAPAPSGITVETNTNASINIKLSWSAYTQGAKQADLLILFWKKGTAPVNAPTINDNSIAFNVNTGQASYYTFEGVNPEDNWRFGIAAARRTENGLEIGTIQAPTSAPDWSDVSSGTATYTGNINDSDHSSLVTVNMLDGFGNGLDGELNSTGNVTITVDTEDTHSVIKQYTNFTLNAGHTLTVDKRCRGLFIFCHGDVTISGIINMNGKAAKAAKDETIQRFIQVPIGVVAWEVPPGGAGGNGGSGGKGGGQYNAGGSGRTGTPGLWVGGGWGAPGGGGGGCSSSSDSVGGAAGTADLTVAIGAGGNGGASQYAGGFPGGNFSGGGGGGGYSSTLGGGGGGGGCNGGGGGYGLGQVGFSGTPVGGGVIVIVAKGNVTIGSGGQIVANGTNGVAGGYGYAGGGYGGAGGGGQGGGGGGVVFIARHGTYTNSGSITVNGGTGGAGGAGGYGDDYPGGNGANGTDGSVGQIKVVQV